MNELTARPNLKSNLARDSESIQLQIRTMLARYLKTTDLSEAIHGENMMQRLRDFAHDAGYEMAVQNEAAAAHIKLQARCGEILDSIELSKGGRPKTSASLAPVSTLAELLNATPDAAKHKSSRWQAVYRFQKDYPEQFKHYLEDRDEDKEITTAGLLYLNNDRGGKLSQSNEWYTPQCYIDAVREVLGEIDLDPASNAEANRVVRARRYYDAATNGLEQPWSGRVFLNPPYGGEHVPFVDRLIKEHEQGNVTAAILLVGGNFDTTWFAPLFGYQICWVDHRIPFYSLTASSSQPVRSSVFVYLGKERRLFRKVFRQFGHFCCECGDDSTGEK